MEFTCSSFLLGFFIHTRHAHCPSWSPPAGRRHEPRGSHPRELTKKGTPILGMLIDMTICFPPHRPGRSARSREAYALALACSSLRSSVRTGSPPSETKKKEPINGFLFFRGLGRIRTAVRAFAEPCLATRPRDQFYSLRQI